MTQTVSLKNCDKLLKYGSLKKWLAYLESEIKRLVLNSIRLKQVSNAEANKTQRGQF